MNWQMRRTECYNPLQIEVKVCNRPGHLGGNCASGYLRWIWRRRSCASAVGRYCCRISRLRCLRVLLHSPGELVTREDLQRALWPGDTCGDFDEGLNKAIQKLRQALDDSTGTPRFIETIPRKGYRFIAAVESGIEES